jgi:hypothetical protein
MLRTKSRTQESYNVEEGELSAGDVLHLFTKVADAVELADCGDVEILEYSSSGMVSARPRKFPSANWTVPLTLSAMDLTRKSLILGSRSGIRKRIREPRRGSRMCALRSSGSEGANFDSFLCLLSPTVSPRPMMVSPVYLFGRERTSIDTPCPERYLWAQLIEPPKVMLTKSQRRPDVNCCFEYSMVLEISPVYTTNSLRHFEIARK